MWLFCKSGFFSAVRHNENDNTVHVRARFKGDLQRLCRAHGIRSKVKHTPKNDYAWRMDFPIDTWAAIVKAEAEGIDYPNFKNAVHDGTERDSAYMSVWMDMRISQDKCEGII